MTTTFLLEELLRFAYALTLKAGVKLAQATGLMVVAIALLAVVARLLRKRTSRRARMGALSDIRDAPGLAETGGSASVPPVASVWCASG